MTADLIAWLTQILDEDAALARECGDGHWSVGRFDRERVSSADGFDTYNEGGISEEIAAHIARHDPAAVLADIAAKRGIIEAASKAIADAVPNGKDWETDRARAMADAWEQALRLEASAYAGRPGYDEGWKP